MDESTRSILVGILVIAKRPLTAPQIVALGRPLRLSATNIKSHLTRLTAEGVLSRTGSRRSQRYWLSAERERIAERIAASLAEEPEEAWTGEWVIVAMNLPAERPAREELRAELWIDGFRPCAPGTYVRPAWPLPWAIDRARAIAPTALCLVGKPAGTIRLEQVQKMYGLDAFDRQARRLADQIRTELRDAGDRAAAFRARLHMGGLAARLVAHDPRLPREIWGRRRGLHELRKAFRTFDARIEEWVDRFVEGVIGSNGPARAGRKSSIRKIQRQRLTLRTRTPAAGRHEERHLRKGGDADHCEPKL
jgi:DNA-binding transcriptional regulator PaaX